MQFLDRKFLWSRTFREHVYECRCQASPSTYELHTFSISRFLWRHSTTECARHFYAPYGLRACCDLHLRRLGPVQQHLALQTLRPDGMDSLFGEPRIVLGPEGFVGQATRSVRAPLPASLLSPGSVCDARPATPAKLLSPSPIRTLLSRGLRVWTWQADFGLGESEQTQ